MNKNTWSSSLRSGLIGGESWRNGEEPKKKVVEES
jgi:hypothetical protein